MRDFSVLSQGGRGGRKKYEGWEGEGRNVMMAITYNKATPITVTSDYYFQSTVSVFLLLQVTSTSLCDRDSLSLQVY